MKRNRAIVIRLAVFGLVFTLLMGGWHTYRALENQATRRQFQTLSEQISVRLTDFVQTRIRILEHLASGIAAGHIRTDEAFQERIAYLYEKFPGFQAIDRVDSRGIIDIAYPLPDNREALGHSIAESERSGPHYRNVLETRHPELSGKVELFTGGIGFTAYVPVIENGKVTGLVLGVFNMEKLVRTCLSDGVLDQYGVQVSDGTDRLVSCVPPRVELELNRPVRLSVNMENRIWNIRVFRPLSQIAGMGNWGFLILVLLIAVAVSQLAVQFDRERARVIRSEALLRTTLDAMPDAFVILDRELHVLNYQPPRDWTCCTAVEPTPGMTLETMFSSSFQELVRPMVQKCLDQMLICREETVLESAEGSPDVEVRAAPYDEDTVLLVLRNITEQRRIEQQLRRTEARYRGIFESSQDAIVLSTVNGEIVELNQAAMELFGLDSISDFRQHPITSLYQDPEDRDRIIELVKEKGSLRNLEISLKSMDGRTIHCLISIKLIPAGGEFPEDRLLGTIHDITQLKELQNQLMEAQKMESIGRLAGGIAHDFNNILSSVLGYASLMKNKITPDHPFYEYVETIERGAVRGGDLTARLLGFARRGQFHLEPLDANEIVRDTVSLLKSTVNKAIEIRTEMATDLYAVNGDRSQLHQVLMNLCVNARDAMQGTEGKLTISTGMNDIDNPGESDFPEVQAGTFVWIAVSDTGTGMDEETMKRIFEPFFSTKQDKGTGLGLAMVYGVVRNHSGFIRVQSQPGQGATFTVFLPAVKDAVVDRDEKQDALKHARRASGETVLFVDDEEDNRSLAREILEFNGFNVITAANGEEAVSCYREHKAEINGVVMDLIMPKMGGQEALKLLRSETPDLPIMLISGFSEDGEVQKIVKSEGILFLRKPFQLSELVEKVGQLVRRS